MLVFSFGFPELGLEKKGIPRRYKLSRHEAGHNLGGMIIALADIDLTGLKSCIRAHEDAILAFDVLDGAFRNDDLGFCLCNSHLGRHKRARAPFLCTIIDRSNDTCGACILVEHGARKDDRSDRLITAVIRGNGDALTFLDV